MWWWGVLQHVGSASLEQYTLETADHPCEIANRQRGTGNVEGHRGHRRGEIDISVRFMVHRRSWVGVSFR